MAIQESFNPPPGIKHVHVGGHAVNACGKNFQVSPKNISAQWMPEGHLVESERCMTYRHWIELLGLDRYMGVGLLDFPGECHDALDGGHAVHHKRTGGGHGFVDVDQVDTYLNRVTHLLDQVFTPIF